MAKEAKLLITLFFFKPDWKKNPKGKKRKERRKQKEETNYNKGKIVGKMVPADYIFKLCLRENSGLVGCDIEQLDSMAPMLTDPSHANLTRLQIPPSCPTPLYTLQHLLNQSYISIKYNIYDVCMGKPSVKISTSYL